MVRLWAVMLAVISALMGATVVVIAWPRTETTTRASEAYSQPAVQELAKLKLQFQLAGSEQQRQEIADTVRLQYADYDRRELPDELQIFLIEVRGW